MEKRQFTTILDTLEQYQGSEKIALICGEDELSYRELIADARHIARGLMAEGVKKGDRVLFSMHRTADAIRALLGILYAGASYVAADPDWPRERLDFAERDARTVFSMTDASCRRLRERELSSAKLPEVRGEDEAAIYYTSGSTGRPKGTVLHHIVFGSTVLRSPEESYATGEIFQAILKFVFAGSMDYAAVLSQGKTLLLSTDREQASIDLLAASMVKHHADAILGTPSIFMRFLENPSFAQAFAGLRHVKTVGEIMLAGTAQRILDNTQGDLTVLYGISEMLCCTKCCVRNSGKIHLGNAVPGVRLHLLDEKMEEVAPGGEGELFIGGIPAKYGHYLNRPDLDAEKYVEHLRFGRLFRTGDLARLEQDGEITIIGRKDGMVKLHGQRIEIGEVESAMMGFSGIRRAAVRLAGASPHEMLAGYYTVAGEISEGELRRHLAEGLPYYMVPSLFMQLDSMPENANGKLDYGALPPMELPEGEYVPPKTEREKLLCKLFAEVLNRKDLVSSNDIFFALGGDSISGLKLAARLAEEGIRMEMKWLFAAPSPALLAPLLTENPHAEKLAILHKNFEEDGKKFLASGKTDSWVGSFFVPPTAMKISLATSIYFRFTLAEDVKESRLREALGEAVRVCPYMAYGLHFNERAPRLAFRRLDDPLPLFHDYLPQSFADKAMTGHYGFVSFEGRELAVCVSHVITDAHGYFRFVNALFDAYFFAPSQAEGRPKPDWAADVMKYPWPVAEGSESPAAKDIFRISGTKKMSGGLQRHFFIDRSSFDVFCHQIGLSRQAAAAYLLARAIQAAHPENDKLIRVRCPIDTRTILGVPNTFQNASVPHMYLEFSPGGLLPKLTEEEAHRINEDVYRQLSYEYVAYTTNILAAATKTGNKADLYRKLVECGRQSELCASYIDTGAGKAMSENVLEMAPAYEGTSGFPVMLYLWDFGKKISVQYTQMFDDASCPDMLCKNMEESGIKILVEKCPAAREGAGYDGDASFTTILDTLEQYQGSEKLALICGEEELSYRQLIADARHIARGLMAEGVKKGDRVLFSMHRRADAIRALLGILYAGASYVAADPGWPRERLDFVERDAQTVFFMTDESCRQLREREQSSGELPKVRGEDEAAIYYTSGSTGQPKGTVLHHIVFGSTVLVSQEGSYITGEISQSILKFVFVGSMFDYTAVLSKGKTLLLSTDREQTSIDLLAVSMVKHRADAISGTPSIILRFLENPSFAHAFAGLRYVNAGGEIIPASTDKRIFDNTQGELIVLYGTTEMYCCTKYCGRNDCKIHLGKALPGIRLHLLDEKMEEVAPGGEGELFIGGIPAKYGHYLNRPDLDAEKYVEHLRFGRLFRTGDLARLEQDGEITIIGRKDGMVKLHGQRIEIGEVESAMMGFSGIRRAAVRLLGASPHEMLAGYYTATGEVSEEELRRHLADHLPYYMVPSLFMQLDSMPENANGKLDYGALPPMELPKGEYVPPKTEREKLLCKLFAEVLNRKAPVSSNLGSNDSFFALGGDSITGMKLIGHLMDRYGISCTMSQLAANPTPAALSQVLSETAGKKETFRAAAKAQNFFPARNYPDSVKEHLADSHIETALPVNAPTFAFLYMKQEGIKDRFNTTRIQIKLESSWKEEGFRERVSALVRNHPALRSFFHRDERGKYWQVIRREAKTPVWFKDISHLAPEAASRFVRGFWQVLEGEEAPFAAACLAGAGQTTLLVQAEHTVADGMSMHVIANELVAENYRDLPVDGYTAHRQRTLGSREDMTPFILDYYGKGTPAFWSVDPTDLGTHGIQTETVALSRQDTDRFLKACASAGILPYSMALYSYGQVILALSGISEVWLLALDSGRYAEWGDELRVVGNLISGMPIRIAGNMTVRRFQEDFLRLRECHHLQDSILIYDSKWMGIPEGIVSNDFVELDPAIASLEVLGDDKRRGNSMTFLDGCLTIRLRHADMEPVNGWYQRAARELSLRLRAVSASFGGKGDEE